MPKKKPNPLRHNPEVVNMKEAGDMLGIDRSSAGYLFRKGYLGERVNYDGGRTIYVRRSEVIAHGLSTGQCDAEGRPTGRGRSTEDAAPLVDEKTGEVLYRLRHVMIMFGVSRSTVDAWRHQNIRGGLVEDDNDHRGYPLFKLATLDAFAKREGLPTPGRDELAAAGRPA